VLRTGVEVMGLESGGGEGGRERGRVATAVCLERGERVEADVVILACGALSQRLLSSCCSSSSSSSSSFSSSMSLPIVPMRGYSLPLPLPSLPPSILPTRCLILDDRQVYLSRLAGRVTGVLRVGGLAAFVGVNTEVGSRSSSSKSSSSNSSSSSSSSSSSNRSCSTAPLEKLMDVVRVTFSALTRAVGWEEMSW